MKGKAAEEEGKEHYPITAWGLRNPLSAWKLDRILGEDKAVCPGLLHLVLRDGGAHRAGGRGVLGHGVLGG
jgi:hypothetical protein